MVQRPNGNRLPNGFVNEMATFARLVEWKAIRLTTSSQEAQVALMMTGICNVYAQNAILLRGVGFLAAQGHP